MLAKRLSSSFSSSANTVAAASCLAVPTTSACLQQWRTAGVTPQNCLTNWPENIASGATVSVCNSFSTLKRVVKGDYSCCLQRESIPTKPEQVKCKGTRESAYERIFT